MCVICLFITLRRWVVALQMSILVLVLLFLLLLIQYGLILLFTHPPVLHALLLILSAPDSSSLLDSPLLVPPLFPSSAPLLGMTLLRNFPFLSDRNPLSDSDLTSIHFFFENNRLAIFFPLSAAVFLLQESLFVSLPL